VAEFIRTRGVTTCPAVGTKELARLNIERERDAADAPTYKFGGWNRKRKTKRA
jgi:hypothetical protein